MAEKADEFSRLADEMYRRWESAMTGWWDQLPDSPEFLGASGKGISSMARARKAYEQQVDEQLTRLHLPTRTDLIRLARISNLLEDRLLQVEDTVLEMRDLLAERDASIARLEKEVVQARVEAAEARLELRERLAALQARLEADEPPAPARRKRSSGG